MMLESEARLKEAQRQSSMELERRIQQIDIQQGEIQVEMGLNITPRSYVYLLLE